MSPPPQGPSGKSIPEAAGILEARRAISWALEWPVSCRLTLRVHAIAPSIPEPSPFSTDDPLGATTGDAAASPFARGGAPDAPVRSVAFSKTFLR